jgi:response regulator RpfG family c-di-GMP phosphodiesterase
MEKASIELEAYAGKQFDPKLVSIFLTIIAENGFKYGVT